MAENTQAELPQREKAVHFVQLDTLRFVAAFMVVLIHAWDGWVGWWGKPELLCAGDTEEYGWFGARLQQFLSNFNFGVDLFFLISGFLITYLLLKEKDKTGRINLPHFYIRRTLRIWPLYFTVILVAPLLVWWLDVEKPEYAPVIFFYNNFRTIATEAWQFPFAHFWSICIEEHFYLVWPLLISLVPMRKLPFVFVAVIAISCGFRGYAYLSDDMGWYDIYLNTLARMDALAIGAFVAWIHFHKPITLVIPPGIRIVLYAFLIFMLSYDSINEWDTLFHAMWKKYLYLLLAGLAMINYMFNEKAWFRFGPRHIITYLGKSCFGIYLWGNILLIVIINKVMLPFFPMGHWYVFWPIVLSASLIVPVLSYELIEKPFLKFKGRFASVKTRV